MSKFNQTNTNKTVNKSGHAAYSMKDKELLVTQVLTTFFNESKFYGDNSKKLVETAERVAKKEPSFVSNLAAYARKEFHLRSVAHVLTCIVANVVESKPFIRRTVDAVVERADDLTEILACYISMYGKPIPNGLKKALGANLKRFNEFQLSKYNGGQKSVKFKDILRLTHVKPDNKEQEELFKKVLEDNLATATRWETELSTKGNNTETWESLIDNNQLGYMALVRNLRNILQANLSKDRMNKVCEILSDSNKVAKSKLLPFRYYSAYKEVTKLPQCSSKLIDALGMAIEHSVSNIEGFKGKTLIAIDASGSMDSKVSSNSDTICYEIASLLGVIAAHLAEENVVVTFRNARWWCSNSKENVVKQHISRHGNMLEQMNQLPKCGGGTPMEAPFEWAINNKVNVDRIIVLSDNEVNSHTSAIQSYFEKYKKEVNANTYLHAIDLQGYGTQQFMGKNVNIIAGWSEKVLGFISLVEEGLDNQVKRIENYLDA